MDTTAVAFLHLKDTQRTVSASRKIKADYVIAGYGGGFGGLEVCENDFSEVDFFFFFSKMRLCLI